MEEPDHYECESCGGAIGDMVDLVQHDCSPVRLSARSLSRQERNTLMYVESRVVDHAGKLALVQMNYEDQQNLKVFRVAGLLDVGEPQRDPDNPREDVQFVEEFTDEAWDLTRDCRQLRANDRVDFPVGVDE